MPWWLMPRVTAVQDGCPIEFRDHNARLSIGAGNQFTGLGRGASPSAIWLSEVCEWPNPDEDIDSSLIRSIIEMPEIFFILESTALGRGNWYHKRWKTSKEGWGKTGTQLYPLFLPFHVGQEIYPSETWLRKNPVPFDWTPDDHLLTFAKRCEEFVQSHPRLRKFMGEHWLLPKHQLWWYYCTREEYRQNDNLNQFLAECCSDDIDAFQSTNRSAFNSDVIQLYHDRIKPPLGVYKLVGVGVCEEDVPEAMRPTKQEIDQTKPIIDVPCHWGTYSGHFQLVPVKFMGYTAGRMDGNVFLYEYPRPEHEYCFGVDVAEGIGADRTVIEMVQKDTLYEPDIQVAEWASSWVSQMEVWPFAMVLGTLYSVPIQGERRQAKAACEVTTMGDAVQWELRKRGWMNHVVWPRALDNKKVDLRRMQKLGVVMNRWSRPYIVGLLMKYINHELIIIRSPYFVEEMEAFSKEDDETKIQADHGEHDDRIFALGCALFALHLLELKSGGPTVAERRVSLAAEGDPVYDPGPQAGGRFATVENWRDAVAPQMKGMFEEMYESRRRRR